MAKSSINRHHQERVARQRIRELKLSDRDRVAHFQSRLNLLNKRDAWDCGNAQCGLCHHDKARQQKKQQRQATRLTERQLLAEALLG